MFIEFGFLNFKLLNVLLYPIAMAIDSSYFDYSDSFLYNLFITCLGFLSAGLIYLIILFRTPRKNKIEIYFDENKRTAINQIAQQQKKKKKT